MPMFYVVLRVQRPRPMPATTSTPTSIEPRFRGAVALVVVGLMSLGTLVLSQLAALFSESFELYYGTSEITFLDTSTAPLSATLLASAITALLATIYFIAVE